MKFLLESRRGELFNKYMSEYDPQILNTVFNDEFSKRTNYKYVDWILSHLEFPTNPHALEVLELVKEFDRIGKNLEVKDLNQYPDIAELKGVIENYTSKSQDKKIEGEAVKVYEDNRVLIIKPLSHKASCKYGAGTKRGLIVQTSSIKLQYIRMVVKKLGGTQLIIICHTERLN